MHISVLLAAAVSTVLFAQVVSAQIAPRARMAQGVAEERQASATGAHNVDPSWRPWLRRPSTAPKHHGADGHAAESRAPAAAEKRDRRANRSRPRTHDGVYFRVAFGPSYAVGVADEYEFSGPGTLLDVALGGTPGPGVALAAVLLMGFHDGQGRASETSLTETPSVFGMLLGTRADWYIDPRRGVHVQTTIAAGIGEVQNPEDVSTQDQCLDTCVMFPDTQ